jgi:hypothetical protein
MTKFIKGRFYAHDTSEYEYSDNHTEYLYCRDVRNENKGKSAAPFYVAELICINGDGNTIECDADGNADTRWYREISRTEFAGKLLEAALQGKDFLSQEIARRRIPRSSADELPDYGFGSDEIK